MFILRISITFVCCPRSARVDQERFSKLPPRRTFRALNLSTIKVAPGTLAQKTAAGQHTCLAGRCAPARPVNSHESEID